MTDRIIIGTRGSALALWQANNVAYALRQTYSDLDVEVRIITTTGDKILNVPLAEIGDKGLFTKELERALLDGQVDVCVHSMKDLPSSLPDGCVLGGMLERANAQDALVLGPSVQAASLDDVPAGARIGTGSLRRTAQIKACWPHIVPLGIRGNVDTRLAKAQTDEYDGVMLASAGLERLGLEDRITCRLDIETMIPAVGQGAIGMEVREGDTRVQSIIDAIRHEGTETCVHAERFILEALEGGCQVPLGAHARMIDATLVLDAIVLSLDGAQIARSHVEARSGEDATALAKRAVEDLEAQGARRILDAIVRGGE